jgi:hypothetical protein
MTSVGSNPSTTSSARGPSFRSSQNTPASSGWGDSGASGSGWGSSANNNAGSSDGWSIEPVATRGNAPPWDNQSAGWGSTNNGWDSFNNVGWGAAGNDLGPGWGLDSNSNQGSKAPLVATIPNKARSPGTDARPDGGRSSDNPDAATSMTRSSKAILPVITSSDSKQVHNEQCDENIPMVDLLPLGREALSAASPEQPLSLNQVGNEPQMRPVPDSDVMSDLLGSLGSEMRFVDTHLSPEDVLSLVYLQPNDGERSGDTEHAYGRCRDLAVFRLAQVSSTWEGLPASRD